MGPMMLMAGVQVAQGVMSAFGARAEAKRKQNEFLHNEYIRQTNFNKQSFNEMMANVNRSIMNDRISSAAATQFGTNQAIINMIQDKQGEDVMRNYKASKAMLTNGLQGKGIDPSSGTGKALSRMNLNNTFESIKALEWNRAQSLRKNREEYGAAVSRMDLSSKLPDAYIPGVYSGPTPGQAFTSGMISAGLQGVGAYAGAAHQMGSSSVAGGGTYQQGLQGTMFGDSGTQGAGIHHSLGGRSWRG